MLAYDFDTEKFPSFFFSHFFLTTFISTAPLQPEWMIANNGSLFASCIAAGIYATNSPEACHYISEHSKSEVIVLDGHKQLEKYAGMKKTAFPFLKALVVYAEDVLDKASSNYKMRIVDMKPSFGCRSWVSILFPDRKSVV